MLSILTCVLYLSTAIFALPAGEPKAVAPFDRYFIITFENTDYEAAMKTQYFGKDLPAKGRLLTNFRGVTHPSQGNYVAMVSGSTKGVFLDTNADLDRESIVDRLEKAGKSWVSMQQDYPKDKGCFSGSQHPYVRKHNPFISFNNIRNNPARCSKIVNADQLYVDIEKKQLADYVFYTPNMDNDGHDTNVQYSADWLKGFLEPLLANPYFSRTLFVITFDENAAFAGVIDFKKNLIYTLLIGSGVTAGTKDNTYYNHYNQLATIEKVWGLGPISDEDRKAAPITLA